MYYMKLGDVLLQAALAEVRMAEWGGKNENLPLMETTHTADFSADTKYHLDLIFHGQSITMFQASTLLLRTPNNKMRPTNRVGLGGYEQDGWEEGHGLTGRRRRRPRRRGRRPRRRAGRPRRRGRRPRRWGHRPLRARVWRPASSRAAREDEMWAAAGVVRLWLIWLEIG